MIMLTTENFSQLKAATYFHTQLINSLNRQEGNNILVLAFESDYIKLTVTGKGRTTFEIPREVSDPRNASVSHECPGKVSVGGNGELQILRCEDNFTTQMSSLFFMKPGNNIW